MSAPSSIYYDELFRAVKNSSIKAMQIAKRGEYALTDAEVKALFKLDKLRGFNGVSKNGFIGAVLAGGANAAFHNESRLSGFKIGNYEFLLDAGLNRKGELSANSTDRAANVATNSLTISGLFRSPLYNSATAYGIRWKKTSDSAWNTYQIGTTIAENSQLSVISQEYIVDATEFLYIEAPFTYDIQLFITNEEGTSYFDYLDITTIPASISLAYGASVASAYASTPGTYYKSKKTLTTIVNSWLFSDNTGTPAPAGYYIDKANPVSTNQYRYYQIGSNGLVTNVGVYTPASRYNVPYSGYDAVSYTNAYNQAVANGWSNVASIWYDSGANLYYTAQAGNTLANGYYMISENEGEVFYHYLINGVKQN